MMTSGRCGGGCRLFADVPGVQMSFAWGTCPRLSRVQSFPRGAPSRARCIHTPNVAGVAFAEGRQIDEYIRCSPNRVASTFLTRWSMSRTPWRCPTRVDRSTRSPTRSIGCSWALMRTPMTISVARRSANKAPRCSSPTASSRSIRRIRRPSDASSPLLPTTALLSHRHRVALLLPRRRTQMVFTRTLRTA